MKIGDLVVRKSYDKDVTFKIIDILDEPNGKKYILSGYNIRIIADSKEDDLIIVNNENEGSKDKLFNTRINSSIKKILSSRDYTQNLFRNHREIPSNEPDLSFGRPGRILHIDGDKDYLDVCLKVYKQLSISAHGELIPESNQSKHVLDLVKLYKPDIVVLTGHDSMIKGTTDFTNISNYTNSKYYAESVSILRDYNHSYDELIIFAGACQSCYEEILNSGANFATSPSRVLIHCLDPVFICEKIAYSNIENYIPIQNVLESTITGTKGIGGLKTKGKYRDGYPKSPYI